ncbi:hypothetical protein ACJ73_00709 [Blastomyces percursus]|uniref:ATP synthase subunit f, mitochondrial n=1 Tax=Blastomyces percursus TaxID=1658174 RepID=A0A1J9RIT5_9EURO|nr:hypothetical protein ACJ73_00709 [Blastomyces percursus]
MADTEGGWTRTFASIKAWEGEVRRVPIRLVRSGYCPVHPLPTKQPHQQNTQPSLYDYDRFWFNCNPTKSFAMSYIARRGLSTLIPPKVASPTGIGAAQDAARMERIVGFYEKLPRGAAPEIKPTGLLGRYQARYFGKNPSAMPIIHAIGGLMLLGYSMDYYFHLRHHKNNAH